MAEIETKIEDGVQTICLNRAEKKNAITGEMYAALAAALKNADSDEAIGTSLILGAKGSFSAGNDIGDFLKAATSAQGLSPAILDFLEAIILCQKPLVAGVDGIAIGVGTTMLMHCDMVLATPTSSFATPFVDLGLLPEAGSSLIAPRLMGHHKAFELLALGETFSAEDALGAGFVNRIVAEDRLEEEAMKLAKAIAAKPRQAMIQSRRLIRGDRSDIFARMREEVELWQERLTSDEARAAFAAFMQKGKKG